jgi:hypothetical protein
MLVGTGLRKQYLKEVAGRDPGPRRRCGVAPGRQGTNRIVAKANNAKPNLTSGGAWFICYQPAAQTKSSLSKLTNNFDCDLTIPKIEAVA